MDTHLTRDEAVPASASTDPRKARPVTEQPHAVLAALAHELRNPLGPVRNAVFLLRARVAADDPQAAWALDLIDRQVGEMAAIIEDVGEVARLWRGTLPAAAEPVDLRDVVEAAVAASAASRAAKRQSLDCRTPPEALPVCGDRGRLIKALTHVLQAAAKAGVADAALTLRLDRDDANARVYVSDSEGAPLQPLPPERGALRPPPQLLAGVGMMLAKAIVELYGGSVTVFGIADDHPRFEVCLPLAGATALESPGA